MGRLLAANSLTLTLPGIVLLERAPCQRWELRQTQEPSQSSLGVLHTTRGRRGLETNEGALGYGEVSQLRAYAIS